MNIVVKIGKEGEVVYLRDVVSAGPVSDERPRHDQGVELGAKNYDVDSYLDRTTR